MARSSSLVTSAVWVTISWSDPTQHGFNRSSMLRSWLYSQRAQKALAERTRLVDGLRRTSLFPTSSSASCILHLCLTLFLMFVSLMSHGSLILLVQLFLSSSARSAREDQSLKIVWALLRILNFSLELAVVGDVCAQRPPEERTLCAQRTSRISTSPSHEDKFAAWLNEVDLWGVEGNESLLVGWGSIDPKIYGSLQYATVPRSSCQFSLLCCSS